MKYYVSREHNGTEYWYVAGSAQEIKPVYNAIRKAAIKGITAITPYDIFMERAKFNNNKTYALSFEYADGCGYYDERWMRVLSGDTFLKILLDDDCHLEERKVYEICW